MGSREASEVVGFGPQTVVVVGLAVVDEILDGLGLSRAVAIVSGFFFAIVVRAEVMLATWQR